MTTATLRVMDAHGDFSEPQRVSWHGGRFTAIGDPANAAQSRALGTAAAPRIPTEARWIMPGLVDAHLHAAWHAFDAADRAQFTEEEAHRATADALRRTLRAGFTSVRDAGGLATTTRERIPAESRPRIACSVALIDRARADAAGGIDRAVEEVLQAGAAWVKIVATDGVGSPAGASLQSHFSATEFASAARRAASAGAGVMVHAWGGDAIDFAIESGAASIEHGIYLTVEQASRAAQSGTAFVPTLRIYRLVQQMIAAGKLPAGLAARVDAAVAAHPDAVRIARDQGVAIALGTDFGTPEQHGTNRVEFDALVEAGLSVREALVAATSSGAALLARAKDPDAPSHPPPFGVIAPGAVADAVLLARDPREPGALSDPASIVGVLLEGRLIDPRRPDFPPHPREDHL
ncbi:amidohydrolase family protein [Leucobacter alluvii]|uniref:Amidohydrolase family protein n=1 Tax=Leucobacter alluvii TaxID=340321 RepID=A0ABN3B7Q8_9MICO